MPSMQVQPQPIASKPLTTLREGDLVGGRFRVERRDQDHPLGPTFLARDERTERAVCIRVIDEVDPADLQVLRQEIKHAVQMRHRNLVATYGTGTHEDSLCYVAHEWVLGTALSDFVYEQRSGGEHVSLRAAFNVAVHICRALQVLHPGNCHGALRPEAIAISNSGRVKVAELGLAKVMIHSGRWTLLPSLDQRYLAPETRAGGGSTPSADIYGLGAILYVLLTGQPPGSDPVAPSQIHPDADAAVDALILRCLSPSPEYRFASPSALVEALLSLVEAAQPTPVTDLGANVEVEIDVDVASSLAPPSSVPSGEAEADVPVVAVAPGVRASAQPPPLPLRSSRQVASVAPKVPWPSQVPNSTAPHGSDLSSLAEQLVKNDAPRWLAVKDGMDHGPFTSRELIKLILDGEVLPDHALRNVRNDECKPLRDYDEFEAFVAQYQARREEEEEQAALDRSSRHEKRFNVAKVAVVSMLLTAVVIGAGGYLLSREHAAEGESQDLDMASVYERGEVKIQGIPEMRQAPGRRRSAPKRGAVPASLPATKSLGSYQEAMNRPVDLGDVTRSGGERQLSGQAVTATMNRHLGGLLDCAAQARRRGGKIRAVRIDLAIRGDGQVMGATVHGGRAPFHSCILGKLRQIRFDRFPAPRMGATYRFRP